MRKTILILLSLILLLTVPVGCAKQEKVVRLHEVTHSVFYAPQYVAMELGYFAEEGLQVELTNAGGADKAMAALLSGQADIGLMGPEAAVYVYNEGRQDAISVVGQVTIRDGQFLLGREADEDFAWMDLTGKSVIAGRRGGMPCMTLEHVLRQQGLTPGEDVDVMTHVQFNLMGGAFAAGEGDYVTLFEPAATQAVQEGYGYILASVGEDAGPIAYTCYMVPKSTMDKDADMVKKFLKALYKGQKFVAENTAEKVAQTIAPSFADTDVAILTQVVERYRSIGAWTLTPVVDEESILNLQTIMDESGELAAPVPFEDLVDNSIAIEISK